ncbi:MAG: diacylglycerol kinase [Planctomycetes bacterium]|nr:diacylglycerol kinase [Planctomycetota bacterium]
MDDPPSVSPHRWKNKFRDAFRGMKAGVRGQTSFTAHFAVTAAALGLAAVLQCTLLGWCIILLCITIVLAAEMFNSALEAMGKAVIRHHDPDLGNALDISAAAVLIASLGAAGTGAVIFVYRAGALLAWW